MEGGGTKRWESIVTLFVRCKAEIFIIQMRHEETNYSENGTVNEPTKKVKQEKETHVNHNQHRVNETEVVRWDLKT